MGSSDLKCAKSQGVDDFRGTCDERKDPGIGHNLAPGKNTVYKKKKPTCAGISFLLLRELVGWGIGWMS